MHRLLYLVMLSLLISCTPKPQEINYGSDGCAYCKMTIVDQQHAAEIVTTKGKAFKFDAIECMVVYEKTVAEEDLAFVLVNDYQTSGTLIAAEDCTYLISKRIPSPMGANLSAFSEKSVAETFQETEDDQLYTWIELKKVLKTK